MIRQRGRGRLHRPRRTSITIAAVSALAAGVLLLPAPASAHAIVESTEPGIDQVVADPPTEVVMTFNEPVEIAFGAIRVFDTRGRGVEEGDAEHLPGQADSVRVGLQPDLADGTYTVTWRVVSADGHPIEEAFVFHVGAPGENPLGIADQILAGQSGAGPVEGVLFGVARWLNFAALLILAGSLAFLLFVWTRGRTASGARPSEVEARFVSRWRRVAVWAWGAAVVATLALYFLQGAAAADVPLIQAFSGDVVTGMASTRFGIVSLVKLALLGGLAALWVTARRHLSAPATESVGAAASPMSVPRWLAAAGAALVVLLAASPGVAGHAGTTPPVLANIPADALHVLAAGTWVGGLLLLLAAAFPAVGALGPRDRVGILAPVVSRYSDVAVVAMGVLVASGLLRTWSEVRAFRAFGAAYGIVLLVKLGAFLPILALGAINNRWTKPRIDKAASEGAPERAPLSTLRRLVGVEVAMATVVLAITAFLVNLPPARVDAGVTGPFITDVRLGSDNLNVLVDPNQVGANEVHLTMTEPTGAPTEVEEMRVLFRMPSEGVGPLVGEGTELATGHFVVQGNHLSIPGEWQLEIVAELSKFEEERTKVSVTVNP